MNGLKGNYIFRPDCFIDEDNGTINSGPPSAGIVILYTTFTFEFFVGSSSNIWLIHHILRRRSKVTGILTADFFPFHLALSHLLLYLGLPLIYCNSFLWKSEHVQKLIVFMTSPIVFLKPLLLCMVCVESYMAVVRPLDYLRFKAYQYRWGCLGVSWCINVLMGTLCVYYPLSIIASVLFFPLLVVDTFCCLHVLKTLQKRPPGDRGRMEGRKEKGEKGKTHKNVGEAMGMGGKQEQGRVKEEREKEQVGNVVGSEPSAMGKMNSMKKKAFCTMVIIQAALTLNYLPFIITLIMKDFFSHQINNCQLKPLAIAGAALCSYLQPLLYLHRMRRLPCMAPKNT